ncbi:hypothetical protein [Moritella sp. F3]|uniref:hypothetical protein n=1 Tax=Moritella sp. F3 TaxID=2718882 RepID=UPI0018E1386E|nr:hypothetical protein [Moritella sp. F3]GIC77118.1 hypothetical protein FMO001_18450 [Moritella sp. F1]GIC82237.1 hypothetical protein FMO003_25180 [Moritella sp. F3]
MDSQHQKLSKIKNRLMKLHFQGIISRKEERDIISHLKASMKYGDTELDSHLKMDDHQLVTRN